MPQLYGMDIICLPCTLSPVDPRSPTPVEAPGDRIAGVLRSALDTFAALGYRGTSMDEVARRARISRPGLYLHFPSKQALLVAAVEHALAEDVAGAETALAASGRPMRDRLLAALDLWAGQYVGPLATDLDALLERDATLLGDLPQRWSARFGSAVAGALRAAREPEVEALVRLGGGPEPVRDVILALVAGTKRQARDRQDFRLALDRGLALLLR